ncbi:MAG: antibiotic biosynthesis monooxygenase family protein [Burkholderiaceae bacterium]
MILEVATQQARPGWAAVFEQAFAQAQRIIAAMPSHGGRALQHCVGHERQCVPLLRWATLQDHAEGFRSPPQYQERHALRHHLYDLFPAALHRSPVFPSESGSIA